MCAMAGHTAIQVIAASGCADDLPPALWVEILQYVPQQQRLGQCALVSPALAAAAAQATWLCTAVQLEPDRVPIFQPWLSRHADHILSLDLSSSPESRPKLQLPLESLTQLQHLQLEGFTLQLLYSERGASSSSGSSSRDGSSSNKPGHAAHPAMPNLQTLKLSSVQLEDVTSFLQLTSAPQLSDLVLSDIKIISSHCAASYAAQFSVDEAAKLRMAFHTIDSGMDVPGCLYLRHLPGSITNLQLHAVSSAFGWPSLPPELPQLSGLRHLKLGSCAVPASVLGSSTQLQELYLECCTLLHKDGVDGPDSTAALLEVFRALTCLRDLKLDLHGLDSVGIAPQRFSALTTCSNVAHLALSANRHRPVPKGAVQHMFPLGSKLPFLQHLGISTEKGLPPDSDQWCLTGADVSRMISWCPQLRYLDISSSVEPGADLSVLLQLPQSCTSLLVGGAAFTDAAVPVLAQLTQLKSVTWSWSPDFKKAGLEQLAGLNLDRLVVHKCSLSKGISQGDELNIVSNEQDCVSQQLRALIAQDRAQKLYEAAHQGHDDLVQQLLDAGTAVDVLDAHGLSPLH